MKNKALFWDFDGTLIYPNESFLCALKSSLRDFGYRVNDEDIRVFLHSTCSWYKPEISYIDTVGAKWWDHLFTAFDSFYDMQGIFSEMRYKINCRFKEYILDYKNYILFNDAKECLQKCKEKGYKNYILSNNFPELPVIIEKIELSKYFSDYIISSRVGFEKPRKEIFQLALNIAHNPDLYYMIGDNPIADIKGGSDAGMKTILVYTQSDSNDCKADFLCNRLADILNIIDE